MKQLRLIQNKVTKRKELPNKRKRVFCPGEKCLRWDGCVDQVIESNVRNGLVNEPDSLS